MALPLLGLLVGTGARMLAGAAVRGAAGTAVRGAAGAAVRGGGGALVRGGLGRGLGGAAARGGGRGLMGGLRRAALRGAGGALKRGAGGLLKGAAKGLLKKKDTEVKKVSTEKLLPGSKKDDGGGALVRKKSSAIVKQPTSAIQKVDEGQKSQPQPQEKSFGFDELIQELTAIKETLTKIKGVLRSNLANTLRDQRNQRTLLSKQKTSQKEAELEKKPEKKGGGKIKSAPKKELGFLDMIWNFISNVLLGSLINFAWNYIPQIIKMFSDISKGMSNTWQRLRIGIITLTTLFPKQIKFLAGLTVKIVGPPAKLIVKLLRKAGNIAGNLFKKAGGIVLNLIKGPLLNLVRRVGGEALEQGVKGVARGAARIAGKAAGAAGGAIASSGRLLNRLKIFSKVLKRVPVIGMLLGIGIDLAMGEPLDRAIIGAIGATLGTAIGGAIGQGLIPIPVVGAVVGGAVGGSIGDWAAKKFYEDMTGRVSAADKAAPIEKKYAAGRIGPGSRSSNLTARRNTAAQGKPPVASSKISPDVEAKAQKDIFKDEKSLERFKSLSSIFAGTPFVGQLLKLGIDIGMGAKVQKTQTDAAAQDLGFTIGRAMENDEFSVPGLNKRIIGPLSRNLTEWAKRKIFNEVKSREGLFPSIGESKRGDNGKGAPGGPGGPVDGGEVNIQGGDVDFWTLVAVASREDGDPQAWADVAQSVYNRLGSGAYSGKSIKDLITATWQYEPTWRYPKGPTKGNGTPNPEWFNIKDAASASAATGQSEDAMKKVAAALLDTNLQKNAKEFVQGRTDFTGYSKSDRKGQIQRKNGDNYFGWDWNYAGNKIASVPNFNATASASKKGGGGGGGNGNDPGLKDLNAGNKGKIFLHWNAATRNDPEGYTDRYHAVFTGDGKRYKNPTTPYSQFSTKEGHTAYRNTTGIGLAIAAMGGYDWSKNGPTNTQLNAMAKEAADIAKSWGYSKSMINVKNVMTHAEAGSGKDGLLPKGDNYGPTYWGGDGTKSDLHKLSKNDADGSGGDKIRNMIKSHMGGGVGNGGSIKKHKVPEFILGGGRILTSGMGMRDFALSPGMHMGVDIHGTTGEPLKAFSDGVVEGAGYEANGYGHWVSWVDDKGIGHFYGHMNKPAFVKKGQRVKKGTILGELGSTGRSSGPHLHWEAATKPSDTGRSKSAVLSRFNPLSKYGIDAPFGGTTRPDPKLASDTSREGQAPSEPGADSPGAPSTSPGLSAADLSYSIKGDPAKQSYISSLKGMGGGISVTSNGGGNKQLKPGKTYGFGDLNPHHSDEGVTRSYGEYRIGVPKDYGMGVLPNYMPSGPSGNVPLPVSGKVLLKEWDKTSGYGRTVVVKTNLGNMQFSHLSSFGGFNQGDQLSAGTILGKQGGSGNRGESDYEEHLHINAPKSGHEAFVNFITSGKPTTGSAGSPDTSNEGESANDGSGSSQPEKITPALSEADLSYSIKGDPAKQSYIDALKQRASYDQDNSSVVLMPLPPQQTQTPNSNISSKSSAAGYFVNGLNSNDIASSSVVQIMSSAFYKI